MCVDVKMHPVHRRNVPLSMTIRSKIYSCFLSFHCLVLVYRDSGYKIDCTNKLIAFDRYKRRCAFSRSVSILVFMSNDICDVLLHMIYLTSTMST